MAFFKRFVRIRLRTALMTAMLAGLAAPLSAGELTSAELPGFHSAYQAENARQSIEEFVPEGETVEDWSRMVTFQRFVAPPKAITPSQLLERIAAGFQASCSTDKIAPVETFDLNGMPAAELRVDCPVNPATSKPETMFARAIADGSHLHVVQVAFRAIPTSADVDWANNFLKSVQVVEAT